MIHKEIMWKEFGLKPIIVTLLFTLTLSGIILLCVYIDEFDSKESVIIELPKGKIMGRVMKTLSGKVFYGFHQIYYAEAPVGPLRFKPPRERKPWKGTLMAMNNTVVCYQKPNNESKNNLNGMEVTEDCLVVNVFTPLKPNTSDELLPVMVAVHGGQFLYLYGSKQRPTYFMDYDIVVVTMNYRLGAFGFLSTEDDVIPGNLGLKDQKFALEWVHDNIKYFNGNASQVTISGGSAGAVCVGLHLIGPWTSNKVLFHGAIQQSNSPIWNYVNYNARQHAFQLGRILNPNFTSNDSRDLLQVLLESTAEDISNAVVEGHYAPIIEKSGDFSYNMLESLMTGNFKRVPLLAGFNSEEKIGKEFDHAERDELDTNIASLLKSKLLNIKNKTLVARLIKETYTNKTFVEDFPAFIRYLGEDSCVNPVVKQAQISSQFVDAYLYQFAYKGRLGQMMNIPFLEGCERVSHGEDIHYHWETDEANIEEYSEADQLASRRMVRMWANFVKFGNQFPASYHMFENVSWPKLNPNDTDNIPYLLLNETLEVRNNPKNFQRIRKIMDRYLQPPYTIYTNSDYFIVKV